MSVTIQVPPAFARLLGTPTAKKLIAQMEAEAATDAAGDRTKLAKELKEITAAHLKALPGLTATVDAAVEQVKAAREVLAEREREARQAYQAKAGAAHTYDRQRGALERALRESADPTIAEFIAATWPECTRTYELRAAWPVGERKLDGSQKHATNSEAVEARVAAVVEARYKAEALQLEVLTPEEVAKRLAALWDSLPAVPSPPAGRAA
jgi:hypothetical protein